MRSRLSNKRCKTVVISTDYGSISSVSQVDDKSFKTKSTQNASKQTRMDSWLDSTDNESAVIFDLLLARFFFTGLEYRLTLPIVLSGGRYGNFPRPSYSPPLGED